MVTNISPQQAQARINFLMDVMEAAKVPADALTIYALLLMGSQFAARAKMPKKQFLQIIRGEWSKTVALRDSGAYIQQQEAEELQAAPKEAIDGSIADDQV